MRDNDPDKARPADKPDSSTIYTSVGHARSLCLNLSDEKRHFLNYAYLISGEFEIHHDINVIRLNFSNHLVEISGYALESLFMSILEHVPRIIAPIDTRYISALNADETAVISIQVSLKE